MSWYSFIPPNLKIKFKFGTVLQLSGNVVTNLQLQIDGLKTTDGITCTSTVTNNLGLSSNATCSAALTQLRSLITTAQSTAETAITKANVSIEAGSFVNSSAGSKSISLNHNLRMILVSYVTTSGQTVGGALIGFANGAGNYFTSAINGNGSALTWGSLYNKGMTMTVTAAVKTVFYISIGVD